MKKALLYLLCLPHDLVMWLFVLLLCLVVWTKPRIQNGCLACELKSRWYSRWWLKRYSGGCLGHAMVYRPGALHTLAIDTDLEYHEHFHKFQYRGYMIAGFIVGGIFSMWTFTWIPGLILWFFMPEIMVVSNGIAALLAGGEFYRDAPHERGARGATNIWMSNGEDTD